MSSKLLIHFDSNLPLVLPCDASQYGIAAVLAQRLPDGSEQPIGYVSAPLTQPSVTIRSLKRRTDVCMESNGSTPTCLVSLSN